jgi:uncharacterized membrane protein
MAGSRDLFGIVVFVVISAVFILVPPLNETPLRAVLGFILVLFVSGYSFVSALFPGSDELDEIERLALSIGLSICIVVFIGIALNYTPWGIKLKPILLSISAFTLALTVICAYRRVKIATRSKSM